tara:strand:+ start:5412 stop:6320 length:909 start_codon:yes stop_codon:yes gene_type:complete
MDPQNKRYLIVQADDAGLWVAVNNGISQTINNGVVNSVSMMATCANYRGMAQVVGSHDHVSMEVHGVGTAEWDSYSWKPLTRAVCLTDPKTGFMYKSEADVLKAFNQSQLSQYRGELNAQISAISTYGEVSSLNTHMNTWFANAHLMAAYLESARTNNILPMLMKPDSRFMKQQVEYFKGGKFEEGLKATLCVLDSLKDKEFMLDDMVIRVDGLDYTTRMEDYKREIGGFGVGVNQVSIHPGTLDNVNGFYLPDIMGEERATKRDLDRQIFTSDEMRDFLESEGFELINWARVKQFVDEKSD